MEARGVEPLSEDNEAQASTSVVTVLMSPEYRPVTGYTLGQPDYLLPHTPDGDVTAYPTKVEPLLGTWAMQSKSTLNRLLSC